MTPRRLVLIADDNRDTREMYTHYLGMIGYVVETAGDGREAVLKARLLRPAVIVLDLGMPGMDGWEAMRLIRADAKTATTPIIVLTGHDLKDYLKHAAIAEGALSYLMKPCLPEQLAREIGAHINARSAAVGRSRVASAE
jgi:CheY-like chemotaxis protein